MRVRPCRLPRVYKPRCATHKIHSTHFFNQRCPFSFFPSSAFSFLNLSLPLEVLRGGERLRDARKRICCRGFSINAQCWNFQAKIFVVGFFLLLLSSPTTIILFLPSQLFDSFYPQKKETRMSLGRRTILFIELHFIIFLLFTVSSLRVSVNNFEEERRRNKKRRRIVRKIRRNEKGG